MSKNTAIAEGGKSYPFGPVKCLMVKGDNGEFCPWYSEADRALDSLSVDKNGIYRASERGVYGWDRVSVSVAQADRVTGRDPETGQEVTVTTDPETGELVETVVPVEIMVIEPPTNPYGVYVDGQTITKDGMVVKAYDANGDEMQTVPIEDVLLTPDMAAYDPTKETGRAEYDGQTYIYRNGGQVRINTDSGIFEEYIATSGDGPFYAFGTAFDSDGIPNSGRGGCICSPYTFSATRNGWNISVSSYTVDGKTVYYVGRNSYQGSFNPSVNAPINAIGSLSSAIRTVAWVICYGTRTESGNQTITVSWPRPGNGAILETTFDILVGPRSGQGDD